MSSRSLLLLLCLGASLMAQTPPAEPGDPPRDPQPESTRLPDLVVTATRGEAPLANLPFEIEVVAAEEMALRRNVQDAIARLPAVNLQRTSAGQTSPYLRGLTGYNTLMMVDGIRLNTSIMRSGPNEYWGLVDAFATEGLEVVFGPSSVLYGSDAVGGTVNALPRRQLIAEGEGWSFTPRAVLRASSAERGIGGRVELAGSADGRFGFVLGTSWNRQGELTRGGSGGTQQDTDLWNAFGDAHLEWRFDEQWSIRLLTQVARLNDVDRVHRTTAGISFQGTTVGSDQRRRFDWERDLVALKLEGRDLDGFADEISAFVSYQRLREERDRIRGNGRRDIGGFEVDAFGVGLQLASETPIGRLTYGFDYYRESISSFRRNFDATGAFTGSSVQGPVGDDASYDLLGFFLQDEVVFGDAWRLIAGVRGTYAAADIGRVVDLATGGAFGIEDSWWNAVGSIRVQYEGSDHFRPFVGASQGFRAPNLSDLSRLDSSGTTWFEIPSPNLDPENYYTFDLGVRAQWNGLQAQAVAFYTILDQVITRAPTGVVDPANGVLVSKANAGDGHIMGFNLSAAYTFSDDWTVFGRFSWTDGQIEAISDLSSPNPVETRQVIDRLPPINGAIGVRYEPVDQDFFVEVESILYDEQTRLNSANAADTSRFPPGGTPGWVIFNLRGGYRFGERSTAVLEIQNLSDQDYRYHGSGVNEPGINVILGVDVSF